MKQRSSAFAGACVGTEVQYTEWVSRPRGTDLIKARPHPTKLHKGARYISANRSLHQVDRPGTSIYVPTLGVFPLCAGGARRSKVVGIQFYLKRQVTKQKQQILSRLQESAYMHGVETSDKYLCPACLQAISVRSMSDITVGHIIPRSATGGFTTLLCRSCNSTFGANQDKWFGEYLYLREQKKKGNKVPLLSARHQRGHFEMEGLKVSGTYTHEPGGPVKFTMFDSRNSPQTISAVLDLLHKRNPDLQISIPVPVVQNRNMIDVGFLTAGYLLWFRSWVYSWALQKHLAPIRHQLQNPDKPILDPQKYLACLGDFTFPSPTLGIATISELPILFAGIDNYAVLFPPAGIPDAYRRLPDKLSNTTFKVVRQLPTKHPNSGAPPFALIFRQRFMLQSDSMKQNPSIGQTYLLGNQGEGPVRAFPIEK